MASFRRWWGFTIMVAVAQALTMMASTTGGKNAKRRSLVYKLKQTKTATEVAALLKGKQDLINPFVVSTAMSKLRR